MRNGKIARLPHVVREELDQRIANGAKTDEVLAWLNGLPEVQAVLCEQFGGRPVISQNLSSWRIGGHQDWRAQQQSRISVQALTEKLINLRQTGGDRAWDDEIGGMYGQVVMQALENLSRDNLGPKLTIKLLQTASRGIVALRQMNVRAERERLAQEGRLAREKREQDRCQFQEKKRLLKALVSGRLQPDAPDQPPAPDGADHLPVAPKPGDGPPECVEAKSGLQNLDDQPPGLPAGPEV